MVFFGRRYYEPETGRWLTPDPKGFVDSLNLYAFVFNDPLTRIDLWGLETLGAEGSMSDSMLDFFRPGLNALSKSNYYVGKAIYRSFFHGMPIPVVRQWGMALGNLLSWKKRAYYNKSHGDSIGYGSIGDVSLLTVSGMNTNTWETERRAENWSDSMRGAKVYYFNIANRGHALNFLDCAAGYFGFQTESSKQLAKFTRKIIGEMGGLGKGTIEGEFHSQGAIALENASKILSRDENRMINAKTYGAGSVFDSKYLNVEHYVSTRDLIPMLSCKNYLRALRNPGSSNVNFVSSYSFEHSYNCPTYNNIINHNHDEIFRRYKK